MMGVSLAVPLGCGCMRVLAGALKGTIVESGEEYIRRREIGMMKVGRAGND